MQKPWDLRERTIDFAVAAFYFCRGLPRTDEVRHITRQLRRSASAVAANFRAAKRAQSSKHFAAKMSIVIEEADESAFWLEFLFRLGTVRVDHVRELRVEANELVAIFVTSTKTARARAKRPRGQRS